jgi:hypothetical protein
MVAWMLLGCILEKAIKYALKWRESNKVEDEPPATNVQITVNTGKNESEKESKSESEKESKSKSEKESEKEKPVIKKKKSFLQKIPRWSQRKINRIHSLP